MEEDVQGTATAAHRPAWGTCELCNTSVPRARLALVRTEELGVGRSELIEVCEECRRRVGSGEVVPVDAEADEP